MKEVATIVLSCILSLIVPAQQNIDSLRQLLSISKTDTSSIQLMNQIAHEFVESLPDSTVKYANEARRLSQEINYPKGEINAILDLANAFALAGNYSKGLEYALDGLKRSEASGDGELIGSSLWSVGGVYAFQADHQQALVYYLKILDLYKVRPVEKNLASALLNVGATYFSLGQLDSSRSYFNRSLNAATKRKEYDVFAAVQMNIGRIFLKQEQYDTAIHYFQKAMPQFIGDNNHLFIYNNAYFLAEAFDSLHRYDSAMYYGQLSLYHAKTMNTSAYLSDITKQLSSVYHKIGQPDSALYFLNMAMTAKDSVNGQEIQKKIQTMTFNERMRQTEIAEQKTKEAETRKRNLELSGIAIFIPLFLLLVLLMGRRKVKSRTIEFLGILGLLFLFEFIVLLVHPYIGHWTHESPIWMLLILAAIAAVLVPLHHRSESWIKKKLSKAEK
jgi:tetratricopeptide (TPR) repeat protein